MTQIDVFNGDADGICALHQLRLAEPRQSRLVTGVKRDIALLDRVEADDGDRVCVLDISLDKNRDGLLRLLQSGAHIHYFDHHFAGDIPQHPRLDAHIDTSANICTSLLVNQYLNGAHLAWAVTAAFGDNLHDAARTAAAPLGLSTEKLEALAQLGTLLNYNSYGVTLADLHIAPDALYRAIAPFADPFDFIADSDAYQTLLSGYQTDMAHTTALQPAIDEARIRVYLLPDAAWTRRVGGVFGNELARRAPNRAHALMTSLPEGGYRVSVRAPLATKSGADELCMQFPTGGGRKAAAGINHLPEAMFEPFVDALRRQYG